MAVLKESMISEDFRVLYTWILKSLSGKFWGLVPLVEDQVSPGATVPGAWPCLGLGRLDSSPERHMNKHMTEA